MIRSDALLNGRCVVVADGLCAAVGVLATLLCVWFMLTTGMPSSYSGGFSDSVNYLKMADFFALGPGVEVTADSYIHTSRFPPAYPAALGLSGGGARDIERAQWVQAVLAVLALITLVVLFWRVLRSWGLALVLGGAAANLAWFFPGALEISSEAMFLGLISVAFAMASAPDAERPRFPAIAFVLALAVLTRVVGVLMLPGLAIWAWRRERRLAPVMWLLVGPVLPLLMWSLYRSAGPAGGDYVATTIRNIVLQYSHPLEFVSTQASFVAVGLSGRIGGGPISLLVAVLVAVGAMLGIWRGVRANVATAMALGPYVLAVLVQPFPADSARYLSIALPLLLPLLVIGYSGLRKGAHESAPRAFRLGVASLTLVLAVQGAIPVLSRAGDPMAPELDPYRRARGYYTSDNGFAYAEIMHRQRMLLDAARTEVPEGECMYAVHRALPELYSTIRSIEPAVPLIDPQTGQVNGSLCRFAYVVNLATLQKGAEPLYPVSRYPDLFEPMLVSMFVPTANGVPVPAVALLRFKSDAWEILVEQGAVKSGEPTRSGPSEADQR